MRRGVHNISFFSRLFFLVLTMRALFDPQKYSSHNRAISLFSFVVFSSPLCAHVVFFFMFRFVPLNPCVITQSSEVEKRECVRAHVSRCGLSVSPSVESKPPPCLQCAAEHSWLQYLATRHMAHL